MSGTELCRRIRSAEGGRFVYIIILSARDRREDLVEGLKAGADDYLTKPFDRQELEVRVRAGQRLLDLQQDLLATQERLTEMATHDGLTGLWNHQAILETLERECARHVREQRPLGVAMADLDRFKLVNDTWGHPVGDTVLAEVSNTMTGCLRPYDALGRYGGEEFLIVLPGCDSRPGPPSRASLLVTALPPGLDGGERRLLRRRSCWGLLTQDSGRPHV
jgi:PleD family two-component response regulator